MIIVEFCLDHPVLREALAAVPDVSVTWERSDAIDEQRVRILVWAEGENLDDFEAAMAADPTVATPTCVLEMPNRRLLQSELLGEGLRTSIYPLLVKEGGIIQNLSASDQGWNFRVAFPNRRSFDRFHGFCEEHGIGFTFKRLYEEQYTDAPGYGLSERQHRTLIAAIDHGYFSIPRECSLAELGEYLGVSETATSERIRRAMQTLVLQTVYPED